MDATEQEKARKEFYRIVAARLDARLDRGEAYTSTRDLYQGYEALHVKGFGATLPPSQSVAKVLAYARYQGRLFYAREVTTHRPERSGGGRGSPYRLYLRADATPPKDHALVPIEAKNGEIGAYIAAARGAPDATLHVTQVPRPLIDDSVDYVTLAESFAEIIKAQAELIERMLPALSLKRPHAA